MELSKVAAEAEEDAVVMEEGSVESAVAALALTEAPEMERKMVVSSEEEGKRKKSGRT